MQSARRITQVLLAICAPVVLSLTAFAADPGLSFPIGSELSDQKAGSVLIYNYYTSAPASPGLTNTRFNITNTSAATAAFVHLFFVEGSTCSISDRYVCLTASQTLTFLASEQDPGTTGYLVALATDGVLGCPTSHNFLIGDEYVKTEAGYHANLGAETISALYQQNLVNCDGNSVTAQVFFDGVSYGLIPRVLAVSNIGSTLDGNNTRLIVNRPSGDLTRAGFTVGPVFGILYDDQEQAHSWNASWGCQRVVDLNNDFPKTAPRFDQVIPAGQTGWMKFWATGPGGILGAVLNRNARAGADSGAFNSGHNLHKLTLAAFANTNGYIVPVFPPSC